MLEKRRIPAGCLLAEMEMGQFCLTIDQNKTSLAARSDLLLGKRKPSFSHASPCLQLSISGSFRCERQMRMALLMYCCCSRGECFTALLLPQVSSSSCST